MLLRRSGALAALAVLAALALAACGSGAPRPRPRPAAAGATGHGRRLDERLRQHRRGPSAATGSTSSR